MKDIEIVEFNDKFAEDFSRLNYEWIEKFFKIEPHDREMLDNPLEYIINASGMIFFALADGQAVGTVALLRDGDDSFELAKMAVSPKFQGLKIGDKLMAACLDYSKKVQKKRVFLLSNTKLTPALSLYRKFGFREIPLDPDNLYERTDIQMEILLK